MRDELRPCPFCGRERPSIGLRFVIGERAWRAHCICGAVGGPWPRREDEAIGTKEEAIAAWNTRQAQEQGSEVQAEVVGKVRQRRGVHGDFDGFEVEWLLEGGIHAIGVDGETFLYVIDGVPVPDDGALTLYIANVGSGCSDNAAHAQAGEGSNG